MSFLASGFIGSRELSGNISQQFTTTSNQTVPTGTDTIITSLSTPALSQSIGGALAVTQNVDGSYQIPCAGYYLINVHGLDIAAGGMAASDITFFYQKTAPPLNAGGFGLNTVRYSTNEIWYSNLQLVYFSGPGPIYFCIFQSTGGDLVVGSNSVQIPSITFQRLDGPPLYL